MKDKDKNNNNYDRLTIKLSANQMQKMKDMKVVFKVSYSTMVRTMIDAYFKEHDDVIEKLIDDYYIKNKLNKNFKEEGE